LRSNLRSEDGGGMKMGRGNHRLTALQIARLKQPGSYGDGGGLYLQIGTAGNRHWFFRFMQAGQSRKMGLGSTDLVSLAEAREKALACRRQLLDGIDPIEARQSRKAARFAEQSRQISFRQCGEKYIAAHKAGWRSADHHRQWFASLENHVYPSLGELPVDQIATPHVLKCLEPIWIARPETASRIRGRIESVLDWATARGFRSGENPARWKGHLRNLLPSRKKVAAVKHFPALPFAAMPSFMRDLRALQGVDARCLEFTILTAARSGEVLQARWAEVDLQKRLWLIPATRMKAHREHRVPLSDRALAILESLPSGEFVFERKGKPLGRDALQRVLKRMGRDNFTVHGFRSSFSDFVSEQIAYPSEVREMALAHSVGSKVEQAYRRTDLFEKRVRLMADWGSFCTSPQRSGANVQAIRAR
jgi:integrase